MERARVAEGHVSFTNGSAQGFSITKNIGTQAKVQPAYALTVENTAADAKTVTIGIYNKEVMSKEDGSNEHEVFVLLAMLTVDPNEAGCVLIQGLYIANSSQLIFTLDEAAIANFDLYFAVREVKA